jgi:hypothetical protein
MDDASPPLDGMDIASLGPAAGTCRYPRNGTPLPSWEQAGYGFAGAVVPSKAVLSPGVRTILYGGYDWTTPLGELHQDPWLKKKWTWELWVKPTEAVSASAFTRIIGAHPNGATYGWSVDLTDSDATAGKVRFRWRNASTGGTGSVSTSAALTGLRTGAWALVAVSSNGGVVAVYVNGTKVIGDWGTAGDVESTIVELGSEPGNQYDTWNTSGMVGLYDTVAAFKDTLSPATIAAHYAAG